jgi:DNA-directed RNA polymerase specialized sigma24 family protein
LLDVESDEVRKMTYCRFVDGMSLEEIALVVGRSRKTVSSRLGTFLEHARGQFELGNTP